MTKKFQMKMLIGIVKLKLMQIEILFKILIQKQKLKEDIYLFNLDHMHGIHICLLLRNQRTNLMMLINVILIIHQPKSNLPTSTRNGSTSLQNSTHIYISTPKPIQIEVHGVIVMKANLL